ncbi:MAG TPA: hypothetical protein VK575_13005, partial [Gemmatimonadaceae bacterium]|nr:hypothetical protein [Gemmatimonadaceae bacterium]
LSRQISNLDAKFDSLEAKVEDGFNASKIREDEILGVARLGLEANEILRDEMNRRFDASDKVVALLHRAPAKPR